MFMKRMFFLFHKVALSTLINVFVNIEQNAIEIFTILYLK
jgi:hypothetical protein